MPEKANNPFAEQPEPWRSCLLYIRKFISEYSPCITESWKFNTPFYYYKGHWLCYISYDKKTKIIYIALVNGNKINHPKLVSEGRKKMKIFYVNSKLDTDIKSLSEILNKAISLEDSSKIKLKS